MAPYLLAFILSTVFVALGAAKFVHQWLPRFLLSLCGVLVVSVLAGIRDLSGPGAGTDLAVYGNPVFDGISHASSWDMALSVARSYGLAGEFGYVWLNYAVSRLSSDPHLFYGVVAFLGSGLAAIVIMMFRDYGPPAIMWLTYLCISYVDGFNLLRQGIAMSVVLLGVALSLKGRYAWGLLVGLSALLFHNSAFVFIPMLATIWYVKTRRRRVGVAVVLVIILSVVVVFGAASLLNLVGGALSDTKYAAYIADGARKGTAIGIENLYRALPLVLGWGVLWASHKRTGALTRTALMSEERELSRSVGTASGLKATMSGILVEAGEILTRRRNVLIILVLLTVEIILLPIREISYPLYRIPLYFGYVRIIGYAAIVAQFQRYRALVTIGAVLFVIVYFVLLVVGRDGLVYESAILNSWLAP